MLCRSQVCSVGHKALGCWHTLANASCSVKENLNQISM